MRSSLLVAFVLLGISLSGWAQKQTFKVKSTQEKTSKHSNAGKVAPPKNVAANAKELKTAEHQNAKIAASKSPKKTGKKATGLKAVKEKNPPINFNGGAGHKKAGTTTKGSSNPYSGRLKQKGKKSQ